jgi:hypothetical protein
VTDLEGNQVDSSDSDFECGRPEQLDDLSADNTSPGQSAVTINKGRGFQVSSWEAKPVGQDIEPNHPAAEQIFTGANSDTQFQDSLAANMSTVQADKKDTIADIKERNDRIDKKIGGEVTQLEINVWAEE